MAAIIEIEKNVTIYSMKDTVTEKEYLLYFDSANVPNDVSGTSPDGAGNDVKILGINTQTVNNHILCVDGSGNVCVGQINVGGTLAFNPV